MVHYNKLRLGIFIGISLLIIFGVIFIGYFGLYSVDKANATLLDTDTSYNIYYPFSTPSNTYIESNLIGFSNLVTSYTLSTNKQTTNAGVGFYNSSSTTYSTSLNFETYNYNNTDYIGFGIKNINSLSPYFNGSRSTIIDIPCTFMKVNNTYTISLLLYNYLYSYSNNPLWIQVVNSSGSATLVYTMDSDISSYLPMSVSETFNIYFNYTCSISDPTYIRITTRAELTGNVFIVNGNNPVFADNTQTLNISNLTNGSYKYGTNVNSYNIYGSSNLFNYEYLYYSFGNKLSLFAYDYSYNDGIQILYYSGIADIVFYDDYIQFEIILSTGSTNTTCYIKFYQSSWVVSNVPSSVNLTIKFTYYFSTLYDYNQKIENAASTGYTNGYNSGLSEGETTGYNNGYSVGYQSGLDTAETGSFLGLFVAAIESPLQAVLSMFDVEILGFNMKSLYMALITLALVLFIVRLIMTGSKGKSD